MNTSTYICVAIPNLLYFNTFFAKDKACNNTDQKEHERDIVVVVVVIVFYDHVMNYLYRRQNAHPIPNKIW